MNSKKICGYLLPFFIGSNLLIPLNVYSAYIDYIYPISDPDFSNYGTIGLIQMPNARFAEEGTLAFSWTHNEPYLRGSILAYPFSWMEASFQYVDINNVLYSKVKKFSGNQTLKDKSFDTKIRLLSETSYKPAIAVGFRDLGGTNLFGAEYIAFSKYINNFDITFGLGWGTLNGNKLTNPFKYLSNSFEKRGNPKRGGGQFSTDSYFSGKAGYFGGIEYFIPKFHGARVKLEYDGTNYKTEAIKPVIQDSKLNFSYVHPINNNFFLKLSYVRGNNLSFGFSYRAPLGRKYPFYKKSDKRKPVPNNQIVKELTSQSDENLYKATQIYLNERNLYIQAADVSNDTLRVAYSQAKYRIPSIAAGRALSILDQISPEKIKSFEVMEVNADMGMYSMEIDRDSLKQNFKYENPLLVEKYAKLDSAIYDKEKYNYVAKVTFPKFFYSIGPDLKSQIGGPDGFYFGDLRVTANTEFLMRRNFSLISVFSQGITNNLDELKLPSDSVLPHVRTDIVDYLKEGDGFTVERMQLNYFLKPFDDLYFKFSGGIFESMFGGYGFESLYRPFDKNFAIGLEAWRVKQREFKQRFGFRKYETTTGHMVFYYREPNTKVLLKLYGGKYLAGDSGITLDLSRRFYSGMQVGVFASKTDISRREFGEGSFDKGFYWWIPVDLFFQDYRRTSTGWGLRPLTRDGAQMVIHGYPLWGVTDNASQEYFEEHWEDFND